MAVNVLSNGVHDDVGTVVQRVLDIGAHECVVNHHKDSMAMRNGSNLLNIDQS